MDIIIEGLSSSKNSKELRKKKLHEIIFIITDRIIDGLDLLKSSCIEFERKLHDLTTSNMQLPMVPIRQ